MSCPSMDRRATVVPSLYCHIFVRNGVQDCRFDAHNMRAVRSNPTIQKQPPVSSRLMTFRMMLVRRSIKGNVVATLEFSSGLC